MRYDTLEAIPRVKMSICAYILEKKVFQEICGFFEEKLGLYYCQESDNAEYTKKNFAARFYRWRNECLFTIYPLLPIIVRVEG